MSLPRPIVDLARGVTVEGSVVAGNVPCAVLPRPDAPGACVMVAFRDGVAYEGADEWGMAHLVEHAVFRGTSRYPTLRELSRAMEGVGGQLSAFSTREQTAFWAKFPRGNEGRACTVLEELLLRPRLEAEALAAERAVIAQERHRETATPGLATALGLEALLLSPDPSARHPLGTDAFLASATGETIRAHLSSRYGRGAMVVAAAGAVDGGAVELLEGLAGSFPAVNAPERARVTVELPGPGPVWLLPSGHPTQVQVAMGWPLPPPSPAEDTLWRALATLLGAGYTSLLNVALREEAGLSYVVTVTYSRYETGATFKVAFACADSALDQALALVEEVIGDVAAGRTPPDVVAEALTRRAANHLFELEDPVRLCRLLTADLLRSGAPAPFAAHLDALEGVTGEALAGAADRLRPPQRLLLLHPARPAPRLGPDLLKGRPPMAITRLDHVSVLAGDAEPTVAFYCENLGFSVRRRREFPDMGMTIIDLDGHGSHLEVIVPTAGLGKGTSGLKHLAFHSDDIESDLRSLEAAGVPIMPPGLRHMEGARLFFITAPAGELVEFIQYDE